MEARVDRVGARPENGHQARLLRLLRDRGQSSRAELGEAVGLSKSKVAVELDRLIELGLVRGQGLAASRGGRRSHLVGLARASASSASTSAPPRSTSAITDGELRLARARRARPPTSASARRPSSQQALDLVAKLRAEGAADERARRRRRRARAGQLARGRPGDAADHAGLGPLPGARHARRGARPPGHGRQRRQHHGARRAARGDAPAASTTSSSSRSAPASAAGSSSTARSTAGADGAPATSATSASTTPAPSAPAATTAASRPSSAARRWPATPRRPPAPAARPCSPSGWRRRARSPPRTSARRRRPATRSPSGWSASGGRRLGLVLAGLVSFFNPGLVVIGGGVAGLGHPLLAEIRSVVYRRSLPLATGNLPVVLSELGRHRRRRRRRPARLRLRLQHRLTP